MNFTWYFFNRSLTYAIREYAPTLQQYRVENSTLLYRNTVATKFNPVFSINAEGSDLVIAIRGSNDPVDFETLREDDEVRTPFGIFPLGYYKAAMNTYTKIGTYWKGLNNWTNIYITGHSYGASVSTILALTLLNSNPNLNVYAVGFGPLPAVDKATSDASKGHIFSFVNNNDYVSRNSVQNFHDTIKEKHKTLSSLTKQQIEDEIYGIIDSFDGTSAIGKAIKKSFLRQAPSRANDVFNKIKKNKKFNLSLAGKVFHIGRDGIKSLEDSVVDQYQSLNKLPTGKSAIEDHPPLLYLESLAKLKPE